MRSWKLLGLSVCVVLFAVCPLLASEPPEEEQTVRDDFPEQKPDDEQALSDKMDEMKAAADAIIAEQVEKLKQGGDAKELYRDGAARIFEVMWPAFGPANAWLFNEREEKLSLLCEQLEVEEDFCYKVYEELALQESEKYQ